MNNGDVKNNGDGVNYLLFVKPKIKGTVWINNSVPIILLVVAVLGFVFVFGRMNNGGALHITQHGEEIFEVDGERIDLNVNRNFVINSENGFNEIEIKDEQIRVASADCPDQTCVNCGFISKDSFNKIIACIPHRLIIEFR